MRKTRNPRFAPESLERKLSPSSAINGLVSSALVGSFSTTPPPPPPPPPPPVFPLDPTGPAGPA